MERLRWLNCEQNLTRPWIMRNVKKLLKNDISGFILMGFLGKGLIDINRGVTLRANI